MKISHDLLRDYADRFRHRREPSKRCLANKTKLHLPILSFSKRDSRRCSGLIVTAFFYARLICYRKTNGAVFGNQLQQNREVAVIRATSGGRKECSAIEIGAFERE